MSDLTDAIEAANIAASKALEWLETEPYGDLRANAARAGLIAAQAAVAAAAPLIEAAARADERAKVAEDIATALLAVDPIEWALAGQSAGEDAAAIARRHAQPAQIDAAARKGQGAIGGKHDPSGLATADDRDDRQEQ